MMFGRSWNENSSQTNSGTGSAFGRDEVARSTTLKRREFVALVSLHYNIDVGIAGGALWARGSLVTASGTALRIVPGKIRVRNSSARIRRAHLNCPDRRRSTSRRLFARTFCSTCQRIHVATRMAIAFARRNNRSPLSKIQSRNWIGVRWINSS
jgi:hypothetical protein